MRIMTVSGIYRPKCKILNRSGFILNVQSEFIFLILVRVEDFLDLGKITRDKN